MNSHLTILIYIVCTFAFAHTSNTIEADAEDYSSASASTTVIIHSPDDIYKHQDDDKKMLMHLKAIDHTQMLYKVLADPRTAKVKFKESLLNKKTWISSPFEYICEVIEKNEASIPHLLKFTEHKDTHFREHAAYTIGLIGSNNGIKPLIKLLSDEDVDVRTQTMRGIMQAIWKNRASTTFQSQLFEPVANRLKKDNEAVRCLLILDRTRAIKHITRPDFLTAENPQLHEILKALNRLNYKVPHDQLRRLLKQIRTHDVLKYPHAYAYREALIAYAKNPDQNAGTTFKEAAQIKNEVIQIAAAEGLASLAGIPDARKVVFDTLEIKGFTALTLHQKFYFAVSMYDAQVNNGGHQQYFYNSSGDDWALAAEGLAAIGASKKLMLLLQAIKSFGRKGPLPDREQRIRQLYQLSSAQERFLEKLDDAYYDSDEMIEVLLAGYTIKHLKDFKPVQIKRKKVVYVLDATGSLLPAFPSIISEVRKSVRHITGTTFTILIYRRDEVYQLPLPEYAKINENQNLLPATFTNREWAREWLSQANRDFVPGGGGNILKALKSALAYHPDTLYIFTDDVTGNGQWEISMKSILELVQPQLPNIKLNVIYLEHDKPGMSPKPSMPKADWKQFQDMVEKSQGHLLLMPISEFVGN